MRLFSVVSISATACVGILSFTVIAERCLAVDQNVIAKSTHATIQDERFTLVGVIAEGDGKGKGIAVIRDVIQNKTHTLKVGELLPGQLDLVLSKVSRQAVILHGHQNDILVGFNANTTKDNSTEKPESRGDSVASNSGTGDDYDDTESDSGSSGLFEKWYQNRGPAVLNGMPDSGSVRGLDVPEPIRSSRRYSRDVRIGGDDVSSQDSESDESTPDSTPPKRTEYSEAMRHLIDKYLNSDTPIP